MNGCLTVARESLRRVAAARAILLFAVLFAAMAVGLSYFGLAGQRAAGFQGFARLTASLLQRAQPLTHRRGCAAQPPCGRAQRAFAHHGGEDSQGLKIVDF